MKRRVLVNTVLILTLPVLMAGCKISFGGDSSDGIKGSGKVVTESRKIADFSKINVDGAANIKLTQGAVQSITVTGDDNILPLITTNVSNGKLTINNSKSYSSDHNVDVVITVPHIEALAVDGFSQVDMKEISGPQLAVTIAGASEINLQGRVDRLEAEVNGAGTIDAAKLVAKSVKVDLSGAGTVKVNAIDALSASVSGVGKVTYSGDPTLSVAVSGLGSVKKM